MLKPIAEHMNNILDQYDIHVKGEIALLGKVLDLVLQMTF